MRTKFSDYSERRHGRTPTSPFFSALGWQEDEAEQRSRPDAQEQGARVLHAEFDELLVILKKNKRKLAIDPARREPQERLWAEFDASVDKLKPPMERIAATDGLIDQIVYKPYGLTEEEIEIVEGTNEISWLEYR